MHIQSFLLAKKITMTDEHYDVEGACVASMECTPETQFPVRFTAPALILLSRENSDSDAPSTLRFDLVDADGRLIGAPRKLMCRVTFPHGKWFARTMLKIDFEFPSPGRYRLDITPDEGQIEGAYQYVIVITKCSDPAPS